MFCLSGQPSFAKVSITPDWNRIKFAFRWKWRNLKFGLSRIDPRLVNGHAQGPHFLSNATPTSGRFGVVPHLAGGHM
jgi:hypothetical protein